MKIGVGGTPRHQLGVKNPGNKVLDSWVKNGCTASDIHDIQQNIYWDDTIDRGNVQIWTSNLTDKEINVEGKPVSSRPLPAWTAPVSF